MLLVFEDSCPLPTAKLALLVRSGGHGAWVKVKGAVLRVKEVWARQAGCWGCPQARWGLLGPLGLYHCDAMPEVVVDLHQPGLLLLQL